MRFFKTMHLLKCMMTAALLALAFLAGPNVVYAAEAAEAMSPGVEEAEKYNEYKRRFDEVKYQIFPLQLLPQNTLGIPHQFDISSVSC